MIRVHWIVIAIFLLVGIAAIKMNHIRHRIFIIFLILVALFLYITTILVSDEHNLNFSSSEGVFNAVRVYTGWLAHNYQNIKALTGRAIDMDWTSTNGTFFSKNKKKK